jgi:phosphopantothenoylcysteine synthetase/decarboxylase
MNLLITAGPTREPLDPVRYLSNRSSGKMGYALASAAAERGHAVTLISGPVNLPAPTGVEVISVITAQEMYEAVKEHLRGQDAAIFSAAVADYRPAQIQPQKIKKSADRFTLELERTPDILGAARSTFGFSGVLIGFAAETENLIANATDKLTRKRCDLIVANQVSTPGIGFDSDLNEVMLCAPGVPPQPLGRDTKATLAHVILHRAEQLVAQKPDTIPPS